MTCYIVGIEEFLIGLFCFVMGLLGVMKHMTCYIVCIEESVSSCMYVHVYTQTGLFWFLIGLFCFVMGLFCFILHEYSW
jgi:hypothetical protein